MNQPPIARLMWMTLFASRLRRAGLVYPDAIARLPEWSPQSALETYDQLGIATGMLSISSPGVHYGDDAADGLERRKSRLLLEEAPKLPLFLEFPSRGVANIDNNHMPRVRYISQFSAG